MRKAYQVQSLKDIKSIHSMGIRSIPKVLRSPYLELYTLSKEKDRIEKEIYGLDKRKKSTDRQLDSTNKRMEKLKEEIKKEGSVKTYRNIRTNPIKTMPISY